jgi:hypothetical protein
LGTEGEAGSARVQGAGAWAGWSTSSLVRGQGPFLVRENDTIGDETPIRPERRDEGARGWGLTGGW